MFQPVDGGVFRGSDPTAANPQDFAEAPGRAAQMFNMISARLNRAPPLRQETPPLMNRYRYANDLPPPDSVNHYVTSADGKRYMLFRYGSAFIYGDTSAQRAYQKLREYAVQSGREGTKILASLETGEKQTHVVPFRSYDGSGVPNANFARRTETRRTDTSNKDGPRGFRIVEFSTDMGLVAPNGARQCPANQALHELAHVVYDADEMMRLKGIPRGPLTNAEEERVIKGAEAEAQLAHGEEARDTHKGGVRYRTKDFAETTAASTAVESLILDFKPNAQHATALINMCGVELTNPRPSIPLPSDPVTALEGALKHRNDLLVTLRQQVKATEGQPTTWVNTENVDPPVRGLPPEFTDNLRDNILERLAAANRTSSTAPAQPQMQSDPYPNMQMAPPHQQGSYGPHSGP